MRRKGVGTTPPSRIASLHPLILLSLIRMGCLSSPSLLHLLPPRVDRRVAPRPEGHAEEGFLR
jgi:hypothetical protein